MKKTNKKKIEEFIRVDHAGERGAIKIYEGQLLALNTIVKNKNLKKKIEEMKIHEKEHCDFFENEIKKKKYKNYKIFTYLGFAWGYSWFWFNSVRQKRSYVMYCVCIRSN